MADTPQQLYAQTGGGDAYRVAMLQHGYVIPRSLEDRRHRPVKEPGKRMEPCGNVHEPVWSAWRDYTDEYGPYQARWCEVCARVEARVGGRSDG